jgi:hypothetical protein
MTNKKQEMCIDKWFPKGDKRRGEALAVYAEGFVDGKIETKEEILGREMAMRCLRCGVSLIREIMGNKINLHLCEKCRVYELDKMTKEVLK